MKRWEDILKERLEGYESPLPEGSFAEFRALREEKAVSSRRKISPWLWSIPATVAAGLAGILLLRQPFRPDEGIHLVQQSAEIVAEVADTTNIQAPVASAEQLAQADVPVKAYQPERRPTGIDVDSETEPPMHVTPDTPVEETSDPDTPEDITTTSPFVPDNIQSRPVKMKVRPVAGVVAGAGLLAAAITPFMGGGFNNAAPEHLDYWALAPTSSSPEDPKDEYTGSNTHYFPLKVGLSTRIPLSDRLYFTTGLEYSLYQSTFTYSLSGKKKQTVQYLGIPVRLDWTLAGSKWLDVYVGAGAQADYCLGATFAGETLDKDGLSFSLLGAGGVQLNLSKRLGLYVEPEISWTVPSDKQDLSTWRTDNPLMFSVAGGIRINLRK